MDWNVVIISILGSSVLCAVCKYGYKTYKLNKCGCDK